MFCHRNGWEDEDGVLRTRPRSQCHWIEAIVAYESRCLAGILPVVLPTVMFSGVSILLLPIGDPAYMQNPLRRIWRAMSCTLRDIKPSKRSPPAKLTGWLLYVSGASARDDDRVMNVDRRMPRSNA